MEIFIILPTQLFKNIKILKKYNKIIIFEDSFYLNSKYHKQKLILHISSLLYYVDFLKKNKLNVDYIQINNKLEYNNNLLSKNNYTMYHPIDNKMIKIFKSHNVNFIDTPLFLNKISDLEIYYTDKHKYTQSSFYKQQRIKFNIFIDSNNKPFYPGISKTNKWSFDDKNRNKFPKDYSENKIKTYNNKYILKAKLIIKKKYKNSFGNDDNIYYPCTHKEALQHFKMFLKYKLDNFGEYQDAISQNIIFGNHSNISALLNIGLLTPLEVINFIIQYYNKSKNKKFIINSVEGIIRQIIGWREYMRFIYYFYNNQIFNTKIISLNNNLPKSWFEATTDLNILNNIIFKLKNYAYLHHIERLMIANNLMYLYEINLKDIYNWFMICFIDSYDWVMIPNILMNINSLENFSKNGIQYMTRVYLASDNYIKKMSDYKDKNDFSRINDLYWKFIKKNKKILKKDYGLASQVARI